MPVVQDRVEHLGPRFTREPCRRGWFPVNKCRTLSTLGDVDARIRHTLSGSNPSIKEQCIHGLVSGKGEKVGHVEKSFSFAARA